MTEVAALQARWDQVEAYIEDNAQDPLILAWCRKEMAMAQALIRYAAELEEIADARS